MQEFEYHNKIMGCDLDISIITCKGYNPSNYFNLCFKELKRYESIFSRFDAKSELSRLNEKKELYVSDIFWEIFIEAEKIYKNSLGLFNPLSQIEQFGYTEDFSQKETFKRKNTIHYNDNFSEIQIDRSKKYIKLQKNQKLDFGGFLKGYLAEKFSKNSLVFKGLL